MLRAAWKLVRLAVLLAMVYAGSLSAQVPGDPNAPFAPAVNRGPSQTSFGNSSNWPDEEASRASSASGAVPIDSSRMDEQFERFEPAEILAQVGDQYVLKGEVLGDANLLLSKEFSRLKNLPPEQRDLARAALLGQRDQLVEQLLGLAIDRKLVYLEYLRTIPTGKDEKIEEKRRQIRKRVNEMFAEQLTEFAEKVRNADPKEYSTLVRKNYQLFRISLVMKDEGIESASDPRLDRVLRAHGTSLDTQQLAFFERVAGQQSIGQKLNFRPEVTHDQMLTYYREHIDEVQVPTRARWEQMSVLFSRMPDKFQAGEEIARMGNQVLFGGAPFDAVARKSSHERNAAQGGYHDWTTYGDLKLSRALNQAIFTLELNKLSRIIEDEEGLHIIRVLEREDAHVIPFTDAQIEIKKNLQNELANKEYSKYLEKLRQRTPITTVYDQRDLGDRRYGSQPSQGDTYRTR